MEADLVYSDLDEDSFQAILVVSASAELTSDEWLKRKSPTKLVLSLGRSLQSSMSRFPFLPFRNLRQHSTEKVGEGAEV